jgi:tetratricopeptide (TPR) repeat protein
MNRLLVGMLAVMLGASLSGVAGAQEDPADDGREAREERREDDERAERKRLWREAVRAYQKQRKGEELTDEEKEVLERVRVMRERFQRERERRAARDRERQVREMQEREQLERGGPLGVAARNKGRDGDLLRDDRMTILDHTYYDIAAIHLARNRHEEAVGALSQLLKSSPDLRVIALTHLNLAEIYRRRLSNTDKAVEEYRKVTGPLAQEAQERMAAMFEELDRLDDAIRTFESIANTATDKTQKALALRQLARLLARNGREDEAVAALRKLTETIDHKEAEKITTALREEQERRIEREREKMERARMEMMRQWQRRVGDRGPRRRPPRRPDGEFQPRRPRERGVRDKRNARPQERPIAPEDDDQDDDE